ncbi:MAG: Calx-beta domain-containing protein [Geminicoccaceae bacterium]
MVGLSRFGAGFGLAGLVVLSGGLVSPAFAESFYLKNGQVIEGSILRRTLNSLTLQSGSKVRRISLAQIERVGLITADGNELTGEFLSWKDGVFEIRSSDEVLRVADGKVLEKTTATPGTTTATAPAESGDIDTPADTIAMRTLPSFILKSGDTLVGKILHATGSVLTIRPQGGSALPLSRAQIEAVNFENEAGEVISGKLLGWKDGVYRLQIEDRELLANLPDEAAAKAPSPSLQAAVQKMIDERPDTDTSPPEIVSSEIVEQADAATLPSSPLPSPLLSDVEEPAKEVAKTLAPAKVGAGGPANETAVAGLTIDEEEAKNDAAVQPAANDVSDSQHLIETQVDAVNEGGESVLFKFQLNKPATRPLVVLYAATEASAKAGEDFEAKSGVITFATGSTYAEVQVPIIDDDRGENAEEFNLFLSGDPESIAFSQRQIAVTINDDD